MKTFLIVITVICMHPFDKTEQKKAKTYLALGDSYTIGQSVKEDERFPAQTVALLKKKNIELISPHYIATTGWTTNNLLNAIEKSQVSKNYDIVTLLIGVNDQYQGKDTNSYRINFKRCLDKAIQLTGNKPNHVIVLSIPDYSVTPFARNSNTWQIKKEIDEFNFINKQITWKQQCQYIDITPSTREALTNNSLVATDGLHPSALEYKKWAEKLSVIIEKILEK